MPPRLVADDAHGLGHRELSVSDLDLLPQRDALAVRDPLRGAVLDREPETRVLSGAEVRPAHVCHLRPVTVEQTRDPHPAFSGPDGARALCPHGQVPARLDHGPEAVTELTAKGLASSAGSRGALTLG